MNGAPAPAPLGPRIWAGAIDTGVVLSLCALYFLIPLLTRGLVLPMWGVLAAVLGYLVVPLAAFKQTLGMRFNRLELVTKDGHPVGVGDVLFRELIGRGFFPAAFLFTVLAGLVAHFLHLAAFVFPTGLAAMFFLASMFALGFAVLGHALVLNRPDRRSLADLMARSYVRAAVKIPAPADADELADWKAGRSRTVRNVILLEVALLAGALALPWILTQRTESTLTYAARLTRQKLEAQAKTDPENAAVLQELTRAFYAEGKLEEARAVEQALAALEAKLEAQKLTRLKARVEAEPGDERALVELLDAYDSHRQYPEAKAAYRRYLDASGDPELRAGFGRWLWRRGFGDEALTELRATKLADPRLEGLHAVLGRVLADTEHLEEAQEELFLALREDPGDSETAEVLRAVDQTLGPLPAARQRQLEKDFEKSKPR